MPEELFFQAEFLLYLVPVLAGELFVTSGKDGFFRVEQGTGRLLLYLASYLYEQALLQVACSQSGGVEVLDGFQCLFQFSDAGIDTGVDGEFVADAVQRFAQQAVVVQRADQVFRQFALTFAQVPFAQLFFQGFVERRGVGEGDFFGLFAFAAVVLL